MADQDTNRENMSDAELDELANFGPAIDDEDVYKMERAASSKGIGQARRCTLLAMARDADCFSKMSLEVPQAYGEMREAIERFREHAQGLLEIAESACMRMAVADCREGSPV